MKTFCILLFFIFIGFSTAYAQNPASDLTEAEDMFERKSYASAINVYLDRIKKKSANGNMYYKAGVCYLNSRSQKHKAAEYFEKAIEQSTTFYTHGLAKESDAPIDVYQYLGDAYRYQYKFTEAIKSYEKYAELLKESKIKDPFAIQSIEDKIVQTRFDQELKESIGLPANFKIGSIVKNGDNPVGEFSSALSPDKNTMVYTLKVPVSKIMKYEDDKYFEENQAKEVKTELSKATKKKSGELNQDTVVNITTIGTSVDGQVMLTYKNDGGEANLYLQRLIANEWSKPKKLPKAANTKGWEPNEFMTPDGSVLYFASDRPGGYGGMDIYRCKKLPNGEWSKAVNLGSEINTPFDDEAPFLHSDGSTLYFSSNRNKPTQTYDILASKLNGNGWEKALVVGYPINSSEDNAFYQVAVDKKKLLAAKSDSDKKENKKDLAIATSKDEEKVKKLSDSLITSEQSARDNYVITFQNQEKASLTLLKSEVKTASGKITKPVVSKITVTNNNTEKNISNFKTDANGKFSIVLPSEINCNITYEADGYLFYSENQNLNGSKTYFNPHAPVLLVPMAKGSAIRLNNIFFEDDNAKIQAISLTELNRIFDLMKNNSNLKIVLRNIMFTTDKGYRALSEERAEAVKTFLVEKGIDKKRIETKGVRKSKIPETEEVDPILIKKGKPIQKIELEITEFKN